MTDDNLKLWNEHEETPADMVKWAEPRGGYAAIDAYHRIKQATEAWGPYGGTWGLRECVWDQITGTVIEKDYTTKAVISSEPGVVGIVLRANFFYPDGCFPIAVDDAYRPSGDTYKKLTTGAITKALSYLGFSADVFMGRFADEKTLRAEHTKFTTESQHDNQVSMLLNLLDRGFGCKEESDRWAVCMWAGVEVFLGDEMREGHPAEVINAIRAKVKETGLANPDVLEAAKIIGPELVSRKPRQRRRKFKSLGGNVMQFPH